MYSRRGENHGKNVLFAEVLNHWSGFCACDYIFLPLQGIYIMVRKKYLFPSSLLKMIFFFLFPSCDMLFRLLVGSICLSSFFFCTYFTLLLLFFHFLSSFFLFLSLFFLFVLYFPPFSLLLFIYFFPQMTLAGIPPPPPGEGEYFPLYRTLLQTATKH